LQHHYIIGLLASHQQKSLNASKMNMLQLLSGDRKAKKAFANEQKMQVIQTIPEKSPGFH